MSQSKNKDTVSLDYIIQSKIKWFDLHLRDLWNYKYLIYLLVKRDFVVFYQQTLLGPLWYILQPLLTTVVFTIVFGTIAKVPTDAVPPFLFYFSGTIAWSYFSRCFNQVSFTFFRNVNIFSMVYIPRLTVPISNVISNLIQLAIQLLIFAGFYIYFIRMGAPIHITSILLFFPFLILQMALLGLGMGAIVSSLTLKYRDLSYVMSFFVQLWMFATPVVYPLSIVGEKYKYLYMLNPLTSILETLRFAFFGQGTVNLLYSLISWIITIILFFTGIIIFTRNEKTFVDTL